jgi:DNA-binding transcriptional ArsR family regulator
LTPPDDFFTRLSPLPLLKPTATRIITFRHRTLCSECAAVPPIPSALPVSEAALLFKTVSDESRLRLLLYLAEHGPQAGVILRMLQGPSSTTVGAQLKLLCSTGLVDVQQRGNDRLYSLKSEHVAYLLRIVQA